MEGVRTAPELRGIIPNSFAHIFGAIAKAEGDVRYGSYFICVEFLFIVVTKQRDCEILGIWQFVRCTLSMLISWIS